MVQVDNQTDTGPPVVLQRVHKVGMGAGCVGGGGERERGGGGGESLPMLHVCVVKHLDRYLESERMRTYADIC